MPQVLVRVLDLVADDRAPLGEVARLVGRDPGLAARFLTVANSAALRRERPVTSLDDCMAVLGIRLVRTIAECLAVESGFARAAGEAALDVGNLWRHSLRVAEMARALAVRTGYGNGDEAYLAGLLHDVGQLLLLGGVGERYAGWLQSINDEAKLRDVEELLFSVDHAAVGAWLADQWQLSSFLSDAILFHHKGHDEIADADPLSRIVWACHVIDSPGGEAGALGSEGRPELAAVGSMFGLDAAGMLAMRKKSSDEVAAVAAALGIADGSAAEPPASPAVAAENRRSRPQEPGAEDEVAARVREMAVGQLLQRNLPSLRGEEELLLAVHETARILFGVGRTAFLLTTADGAALAAAPFGGQPEVLQRLAIRFDGGRSLAAATLLDGEPRCTLERDGAAPVSLVDLQVARALGSEGVLYLPMCTGERGTGVMACAVTPPAQLRLGKILPRLTRFARQAAAAIEAWRALRDNEERIAAEVTGRYRQHARRIVHEAGNPLGIIKNYLAIVSQKLPAAGQELDIVREEVDRVTLIVQRLTDPAAAPAMAAAGTAPATDAVDINGMIEGMLALYGDTLFSSQGIIVEKELAPSLLPVAGNRDSIKQILFNLWSNAADALESGDRLAISTADNVVVNGRFYVEIALRDSGPGLPPEVMQRLFQPKEESRPGHAGIGLSIVWSLVEELDGVIKCRSNAGMGTSFYILLPRKTEIGVAPGR